jgi:hypothetical protein
VYKAVTVKSSDYDSLYNDLIKREMIVCEAIFTNNGTVTVIFTTFSEYLAAQIVKEKEREPINRPTRKSTTRKEQDARARDFGAEVVRNNESSLPYELRDRYGKLISACKTISGIQKKITQYKNYLEAEALRKHRDSYIYPAN